MGNATNLLLLCGIFLAVGFTVGITFDNYVPRELISGLIEEHLYDAEMPLYITLINVNTTMAEIRWRYKQYYPISKHTLEMVVQDVCNARPSFEDYYADMDCVSFCDEVMSR